MEMEVEVLEIRRRVAQLCEFIDSLRQTRKDNRRLILAIWLKMCYEMLYLIDEYLKS
ncbi:MAG: hypothetical protein LM558_01015 [Thermosphaera sp.]|nr:hypothetical protein [Thermosphaera sp.]